MTDSPLVFKAEPMSSSLPVSVGVLLVHGLNGGIHDMEELAAFLSSFGMVAETIVLPGHGTHVRDMLPMGWEDWADAV
ncbi:MAG: carboxylesterase, partial [Ktedonobacteraceae bacterium]|nr:carboxylesterase [Ktedonobacteraceae bacterium]